MKNAQFLIFFFFLLDLVWLSLIANTPMTALGIKDIDFLNYRLCSVRMRKR